MLSFGFFLFVTILEDRTSLRVLVSLYHEQSDFWLHVNVLSDLRCTAIKCRHIARLRDSSMVIRLQRNYPNFVTTGICHPIEVFPPPLRKPILQAGLIYTPVPTDCLPSLCRSITHINFLIRPVASALLSLHWSIERGTRIDKLGQSPCKFGSPACGANFFDFAPLFQDIGEDGELIA